MWRTEYTVEGSGLFPYDMLRYDKSYPIAIQGDIGSFESKEQRQIQLCKCVPKTVRKSHAGPTIGRWNSFGWKIVEIGMTHQH